jgi:nucleolar protein 56
MKAYVAVNIAGVFAFDESGKVVARKLFQKDADAIADKLSRSRDGEVIEEEKAVVEELRKAGCKEVVWDKHASFEKIATTYDQQNKGKEIATNEFRRLALENKWVSSQAELNTLITRINVLLAGQKIKNVGKDKAVIQVIGIIDEMDADMNSLSERLREWYGLHFPELSREIKSHERYAEIVDKFGNRGNIKDKAIAYLTSKSVGMDFSEDDQKSVREFSKTVLAMIKTRARLAQYLENVCQEIMPNLSAIAGPLLASRLVAHAGGLEKIAKMPSSTIQLLGAEKALFRHLKGQGKAPKYGVLFSHPLIQQAPKQLKGKIARLISSKLSLAARMDFYSKKDHSKEMKGDLERKVNELMKGFNA